jgi:multidrug resistance efflux pump
MKPDPLPPIPSPPSELWRQFRVRVLPLMSFATVLCLTIWLWGRNLANPLVMGTAEAPRADVASPVAGRLAQLKVALYQNVKAGDVIAIVEPGDPAILNQKLCVIRAEMELIRTEAGFNAGDKVRYSQFQLDWMLARADLVQQQNQLQYAQNEFDRTAKLVEEKIVDQSQYDVARRDLAQAKELFAGRTAAVGAAEKAWKQLNPSRQSEESPSIRATLAVAEQKLRLAEAELKPIVLTAAIDGCISSINKPAGSTVGPNEAILEIADPVVDRIVGYVSQPVRVELRVGMEVEVRNRGLNRVMGRARIVQIGPRIELFDAPLRVRGMGNAQQRGLPILVNVPPNMKLLPGELVDLALSTAPGTSM